ncbi:ATP phosphoribosyltransferase regulatory subunit [Vallitalea pronyensis]|uniref:ATP phosphoribosyltransferase regulatory subunit n=1 Tax=Vallitalea pronyensis TaxID=1348613 RepID=A0A8J8MKR2_9FIRM|nr:ATP phosphoribosyltransferase regulatory subunit [Vallitalea pronyensis]QUI23299.1 ATP phosphoribosyltransferase regulatory subunit [Vallitalea pronyensis]
MMIDRLLHTPEGVRDFNRNETSRKKELKDRIGSVFHRYGFRDIETPTFEYYDVFNHERGTVDIQLMYKFFDRDGNILALRPDITPSIARYVATHYKHDCDPLRLCYMGNTYRNNVSYQGKAREVTQAGVEFIGNASIDADAEVIALIINSLSMAGLKEFQIDLGQAGFFKGLAEEAGLDQKAEEELRTLIDEKNFIAVENLLNECRMTDDLKEVFLDLPKLFGSVDVIDKARQLTQNKIATSALDRLEMVYGILCDYGVEDYVSFDLGLVSHLNYYTGIIFRGYTYGTGVSIVDGGRYDTLLKQFGKDVPAIGFAIVVDELLLAMERQQIDLPTFTIDTLVLYSQETRKEAIQLSEEFRSKGMHVETGLLGESLEANIAYGKKQGVGGIMAFKSKEQVLLINLENMEQTEVAVSELFDRGDLS